MAKEASPVRESYLDIAKGIGILLVIFAHTEPGFIKPYIYSYHLPIFFMVSGICFHYRESFFDYLKSKARRCLIPYFAFGIIIVLVESKTGYLYSTGFKPNMIMLLKQERYSTLWFLTTLFLASLMFYWIVRICRKNPIVVLLVSLVLSVIFVYLDENKLRALPWNLDTAFIVLAFMAAGFFIKNYMCILDKLLALNGSRKIIAIVICFIVNIASCTANMMLSGVSLEMYWNCYGIYPIMLLSAFTGVVGVILLSSMIKWEPIETLGRNSLVYFALHQSLVMGPMLILLKRLHIIKPQPGIGDVISKIILFAASLIICYAVDTIVRRTKLKIILGE